ncbi:MAG TPA: LuxR family transcriptional regulator [bacterium]|nr:LuxR family transcriptional regulator [bacterium]HPP87708.1 LuxR family transcriptional regulator [bacterium]
MKNYFKIFYFLIFFVICEIAANKITPLSANERLIRIALFQDEAPYSYIDDKNIPQGLFVDYWRLLAQKKNYKINFFIVSREQALSMLENDYVDICGNLLKIPEELNKFSFSKPIFESKAILFTKNFIDIKSIDEIETGIVGVIAKSLIDTYMTKYFPKLKMQTFPTKLELSKFAQKNQLDFFIIDIIAPDNYIEEEPGLLNYRQVETIYINKIRAVIKKEKIELLNEINDGIQKITDIEKTYLIDKWITKKREKSVKNFNWVLIITILSLIILFIIHKIYLKYQIKKAVSNLSIDLKKIKDKNDINEKEIARLTEITDQQKQNIDSNNIMLQEIIKKYENDIKLLKEDLFNKLNFMLIPIIDNFKTVSEKNKEQLINMAKKTIEDICIETGINIISGENNLTPRELEICNYIKNDLSNKEIAALLNISIKSVEKHRENIRKKLGITYQNVNLKDFFKK